MISSIVPRAEGARAPRNQIEGGFLSMRISFRPFTMTAVLTSVIAVAAAAEDLTIVSKRSKGDGPPATETSYLSSAKMRMGSGDGNEVVVDYATGDMTVIDNKKKEYSVMTRQEMEAAAAQMQAQMKQMEAQMQNLPPAVREKMGGMMGGAAQAVNVQKGTGGRTIAGYACENWIVSIGELSRDETCLTTQLQLPEAAFEAQKSFATSMSAAAGPMAKSMGAQWDKFKEMKGYPLASTSTVKLMGKSMTMTSEVTEIKKGSIPASAFEVPAGYKKVESPMAKMIKKQK
jgi:hypothetical protein